MRYTGDFIYSAWKWRMNLNVWLREIYAILTSLGAFYSGRWSPTSHHFARTIIKQKWPFTHRNEGLAVFYLLPETPKSSSKNPPPTPYFLEQEWEAALEHLSEYCPGGYHPAHIGDQYLNGHYEIASRPGYGSYAAVWFANDHQEAN